MKSLRISALLLSAVLVGCGKKNDPGKDGGDPNATYTIKIPNKKAGEKYEITTTEETDDIALSGEASTKKNTSKSTYTEHVETMGTGRALTKGKHVYTTAEETKGGKTTNLAFAGKTVLIEQKPDKSYSFKYEGGAEVPAFDAIKLRSSLKDGDDDKVQILLPEKAVKVGETWTIDSKKLAEEMNKDMKGPGGPAVDATKITATGKLTKAYKKDGAQFGIIELTVKMPSPFGDVDMTMSIDGCIDGTVMDHTMDQSVKISAELQPGKKIDMNQKRTMVLKTVK